MANLPPLSGPVSLRRSADVIPFHPGLSGEVLKAQKEDLKTRRDNARGSETKEHNKYSDVAEELINFMHSAMREATSFKVNTGVQSRLEKNLAQIEGRYSPREIALMGGRETAVWFNLTERRVRTFVAFLRKTLAGVEVDFPQYELSPTRVPDPPPEMLERAENAVLDFIQLTIQSGQELREDEITDILSALADTMRENVQAELNKSLRRGKAETDDILQKMNWAKIIDDLIHDLVAHGTAICYGPYPEIIKRQYYDKDKIKVRHERCMGARRLDPQRVYPSADSKDTQDGSYIIIHDEMTRCQLNEARSMTNSGWIDAAICTVLEEFGNKSRYWCAGTYYNGFAGSTEESTNNNATPPSWMDYESIDVLKFYGKIPGKLLIKHGIDNFDGKKIDEKESVEGCVYWIGDTIVKVNCNIDPLCERPLHKAVLFNSPGRFWGRGACESIEPQQRMANSFTRAIIRNTGYSSAPIFEYDKALTRPTGANKDNGNAIYPNMIIEKNSQITGLTGQALHVHQFDARISEFMNGIREMEDIADNVLGLPQFLTGSHSGGGAARTYSGLQQLTENAAIQIRSSIINLDFDLIKPFINRVYRWMIMDRKDPLLYSDIEVITQGASALLAREVNKDRLTALIGLLLPFAQAGIVTPQGITYILAELIKDHGLDPTQMLTDNLELSRFGDIIRQNLAGVGGFAGGQAAAAAPDGTITQAGAGAPQIDPIAQLLAQGQVQTPAPGGQGTFVNPVGVAA